MISTKKPFRLRERAYNFSLIKCSLKRALHYLAVESTAGA